MPDPSKMIIARPKSCHYCGNGYYALNHVAEYATSKGWAVTDLSDDQANKTPIYDALNSTDAQFFYGFGHGQNCAYSGDSEQSIFTCEDNSILKDREIYLLSCLTANGLGPSIIQNGGKSYAGYNISWTWTAEKGPDGDPYTDKYALCFWESANEFWIAISDGESFRGAMDRCIAKYTEWIEYWYDSDDPKATEQIGWLLHDRDGLVYYYTGGYVPDVGGTQTAELPYFVPVLGLIILGALWYLLTKKTKKQHAR